MKKLTKRIVIMIAFAAAVAIVALISMRAYSNSPAGRAQHQLALGTSYLQELKYDEAIASFKEALTISPDSGKALENLTQTYLAYSDAATGTDDYKAGMKIVKEGIEYLQDLSNSSDQQTAPDADALASAIKQLQTKLDELQSKQAEKEEAERQSVRPDGKSNDIAISLVRIEQEVVWMERKTKKS